MLGSLHNKIFTFDKKQEKAGGGEMVS